MGVKAPLGFESTWVAVEPGVKGPLGLKAPRVAVEPLGPERSPEVESTKDGCKSDGEKPPYTQLFWIYLWDSPK